MADLHEFAKIQVYGPGSSTPRVRTKRHGSAASRPQPTDVLRQHVPLRIVAQDPSVTASGPDDRPLVASVEVPGEPLRPGPRGERFFVVDFNPGTGETFGPHALTRSARAVGEQRWAVEDVLPENFSRADIVEEYQFHAQNVYATCAWLLARFEQVLGRRIPWSFGAHQLQLVPHAFEGANAGYSPDDRCISFGYLPPNGPSEAVYTCLSHDIIAHELTHAIVDGLRPRFIEPGLPDQLAFHEGFADIVALLSVFALTDIVELTLTATMPTTVAGVDDVPIFVPESTFEIANLQSSVLFRLGEQLGRSIDPTKASLRASLMDIAPGRTWRHDPAFDVAHRRGELLVAAISFVVAELWHNRLQDLRRFGEVPLHRAAEEGAKVAGQVLGMCIRALDYLPPIDLDFADFVDAILAADEVVAPDDERHYRDVIRASFAAYDIPPPKRVTTTPDAFKHPWRHQGINQRALSTSTDEVSRFVWQNAENFGIDLDLHLHVDRVLAATRTGPDGLVVETIVVDYTQTVSCQLGDLPELARAGIDCPLETDVQIWGGGVIVFDQWGVPRYHVAKDILRRSADMRRQQRRLAYLATNSIFDTKRRLGFSTGESDTARFQLLHDYDLLPSERW